MKDKGVKDYYKSLWLADCIDVTDLISNLKAKDFNYPRWGH
jgi:hypothetical protein